MTKTANGHATANPDSELFIHSSKKWGDIPKFIQSIKADINTDIMMLIKVLNNSPKVLLFTVFIRVKLY